MAENKHLNGGIPDDGTVPEQATRPSPIAAEAEAPTAWQPGDVILDLYEVQEELGKGGMGVVHRVRHRTWNVDLAVKSPLPELLAGPGGVDAFVQEAELWVNLPAHPHIVTCHYVRVLGGIPRIFAEYVEGGSLEKKIASRELTDLRPILDIAIQMAWGLAAAHKEELVHQDVKPGNVLLTADGTAKITDFGLARAQARAAGAQALPELAGRSIVVSRGGMTPAYASPEQMAGKKLSRKTDIWSWAVSVLEMFTGGVTWGAGPAAAEALEEYLARGPEGGLPAMPEDLVRLLRRCFAWESQERPQGLAEVANELQEVYREAVDEAYPREAPEAVQHLADGLNNRALSMLDLGREEEAERLWEEALKADPHHPHATYNRGLHLWRSARIADDELVRQMEAVRTTHAGDWVDEYLLGLVHLERGGVESAVAVLEEAARAAPEDEEVAAALEIARKQKETGARCLRTLEGHTSPILGVALTADGRFALSGSSDFTLPLRLWELATGQCLRTLEGHTEGVTSVALTPDGRFALSGSWDKTVRLWELATGRCLRTLEGHTEGVTSVALTPDGHFALSGSWDNTVRLWELATGQCLRTLEGHTNEVSSVALTADGRFALSGSGDKTLRLWDLATGRCLRVLEGHGGSVHSVAVTADGRFALSGSVDETLRLWELATGQCLRTLKGHTHYVKSVALTVDGRFAVSGSLDKTLRLWELATGRCLRTLEGHTHGVNAVALSPDGHFALSGSGDNTLRLWELRVLRQRSSPWSYTRPRAATVMVQEAAVVRQKLAKVRGLLAEGEFSQMAAEVQAARRVPGYERHPELLESWYQAGRGGRRTALLGAWHVRTLEGHTSNIESVTPTPDGRFALSGSHDHTLRLWDLASGRCLRTLMGHTGWVESVALAVDGRFALSGSWDNTLRLWDVTTGQCLRTLEGHTGRVESVALTADGRFALSASDDKTLRLWDLATGRCLRILEGHTRKVTSVTVEGGFALSGDGGGWLGVDQSGTLLLWHLPRGKCLRTLEGHTAGVQSVALTADGRFALSGSADKTLRLWDVTTGQCLRTLEGHTDDVNSVALTADGRFALSGGGDKTLRLWELDWHYEFPDPADWDKGARPYLETFLTLHTPYASADAATPEGLTRRGKPSWNEEDFQGLIRQLQYAGYGWLRPEGVRAELERMARDWEGPPPLFGRDR